MLKDLIAKLSSCWIQALRLSYLCLLNKWKEKQLEKMSIILCPGGNSELSGSKEENTLLKQLSISTTGPLISSHWHLVREPRDSECCFIIVFALGSMRERRIWLEEYVCAQSCNLPLSFWRWRLIGIRSAMASMPNDRDNLNVPNIQMAALLCILPNIFNR